MNVHEVRGKNLRWAICAMHFYATSVNYLDRQVLGILSVTLQHSIGWSDAQYGYIIAAFQVAYAIGIALSGRLIDRVGTRTGYAIVMGIWSVAAASHAFARSAFSFGVARFFLGSGESGTLLPPCKRRRSGFRARNGLWLPGSSTPVQTWAPLLLRCSFP
jgi:ACS family hexuronate transporter-like MFS transporter